MFEEADNFVDIFRGGLPFYVLITLPILLICSSNPVLASSEFNVQRMTQYDLHGAPFGNYYHFYWIYQEECVFVTTHLKLFITCRAYLSNKMDNDKK